MRVGRTSAKGTLAALVMVMGAGPGVGAAEEGPGLPDVSAESREEMVVTATRYPKRLDSIPANVSVITAEEIEHSVARNIPDLLRTQAGLHVTDIAGNRASYSVDIRGFGETAALNTLVLVDGRRINSADLSGTDWTTMPLNRVDRIEIIRGARSSVIYGDNASGGVINIITQEGQEFEAGLQVAMGSYATLDTTGYIRGSEGKLNYAFSGSRQHSGGYRENSGTQFDSLGADFRYYPVESLELSLSGGYTDNEARLPGALTASDFAAGAVRTDSNNPDDFADVEDYYVMGGAKFSLGTGSQFEVETSLRRRGSVAFATFVGGNFTGETELETILVSPQFIVEQEVLGLKTHMTLGFDYESNAQDITNLLYLSSIDSTSSDVFRLEKRDYGYFFYEEIELRKGVRISAGYRYDRADFSFGPAVSEGTSLDENLYTAGLTWRVSSDVDAYFSFSRGFRYPVLDELFNFGSNSVNTALVPQVSKDYEAGVRHRYDERLGMNLNYFQIETDRELFYDPQGGPFAFGANVNLDGETRRRGVEVSAQLAVKDLTFDLGYQYTDAEILSGVYAGNGVPGVPAHQLTLSGVLSLGGGFSLAADAGYVGSRPFISDFANAVPDQSGYFAMNAKVQYQREWLSVFIDLNNLTDAEYSEYGVLTFAGEEAVYPSPEFNFLVGLSLAF
ncbi:MAG TPA: TonB-dependent receptor [Myxococcales bacterium]|nr:TonB-dependent receptor [Myxococcales bacterium]